MAAVNDLFMQRKAKAIDLISRTQKLENAAGRSKLQRKIVAEQDFLSSLEKGKQDDSFLENHLKSSNLAHLETILTTAEVAENVNSVLKKFTYSLNGTTGEMVVDVETQNGKVWFKVFARNPLALHRIWEGLGQYGDRDLCNIAVDYQNAASQNIIDFVEPKIVFLFACGVTESVSRSLSEMGIIVVGEVIDDPNPENNEKTSNSTTFGHIQSSVEALVASFDLNLTEQSTITKVNLDVTTLIALVSSLTNGNCFFEFEDEVLNLQAAEERNRPVLPSLNSFLQGKDLYVSQTALDAFNGILTTIGGEKERERAIELLKQVTVVENNPSKKAMQLTDSASIKMRSKLIFGTGDSLQATTTTANRSVVRAAHDQGVDFSVFFHSPRALTERKELKARPLS